MNLTSNRSWLPEYYSAKKKGEYHKITAFERNTRGQNEYSEHGDAVGNIDL